MIFLNYKFDLRFAICDMQHAKRIARRVSHVHYELLYLVGLCKVLITVVKILATHAPNENVVAGSGS